MDDAAYTSSEQAHFTLGAIGDQITLGSRSHKAAAVVCETEPPNLGGSSNGGIEPAHSYMGRCMPSLIREFERHWGTSRDPPPTSKQSSAYGGVCRKLGRLKRHHITVPILTTCSQACGPNVGVSHPWDRCAACPSYVDPSLNIRANSVRQVCLPAGLPRRCGKGRWCTCP
ncbi:hypothetical protein VTI74DRAFT_3661 [Chaetomium olivicolor]